MPRASRLRSAAAMSVVSLFTVAPAAAQDAPPQIPDAVVRNMLVLGLQNIHRGWCGGLDTCAPATKEEFEIPPVSLDHTRSAVLIGTRSALARWCGLDADRRSVQPMLKQIREKLRFNQRQIALMVVIHGIQQDITAEQLKARGTCDAKTRSQLDAQLPKS